MIEPSVTSYECAHTHKYTGMYMLTVVAREEYTAALTAMEFARHYSDLEQLDCWNRGLGRTCAALTCNRVQARPQPGFVGHCCAGCRAGEDATLRVGMRVFVD